MAAAAFMTVAAVAQSANIPIMPVTPTAADGIPAGAEQALRNKIAQIASASGMGSMNRYAQFCLAVSVDTAFKEVVPGAPAKFVEELNFNFYIVDQFDKKVFSSTTVTSKGLGNSEAKAYVQAISAIPAKSAAMTAFVAEGRKKIIDYYTHNAPNIIAKAYAMAKQEKYEEGLFYLSQIPEACGEVYLHATAASVEIYNLYLDRMCSENLAKAKAIWNASQTADGAMAAGVCLARISPEGRCYPDAEALFEEIKREVKDDKEFAKNFMIKQWDDAVALESQAIEAARQIGVAWGENQQPITYTEIREF